MYSGRMHVSTPVFVKLCRRLLRKIPEILLSAIKILAGVPTTRHHSFQISGIITVLSFQVESM
jgi:hypothetical protein